MLRSLTLVGATIALIESVFTNIESGGCAQRSMTFAQGKLAAIQGPGRCSFTVPSPTGAILQLADLPFEKLPRVWCSEPFTLDFWVWGKQAMLGHCCRSA